MAQFKITKATQKGKTWQAKGVNPKTDKEITIPGGQKGVRVGPDARARKDVKAFLARHGNKTPKQYINNKLWKGEAKIGSTVNIPNNLF